jgi:DNA-binding NarL/FixJ family response regulator
LYNTEEKNFHFQESTQMSIQVVIADDHPLMRSGVKNVLNASSEIVVVGEAADGQQAISLYDQLQPDVLVLDVNMPGMKTLEVIKQLKGISENRLKILILTAYSDPEMVNGMLKAGADGYLLKDEEPEIISLAVKSIYSGQTWISPLAMKALLEEETFGLDALSVREIEVLQQLAQGLDNPGIAEALNIAEGTVKNHISNIYEKIGVHSRAEAVAWAWKHGIHI